jgi:hypothetical protein
MEFKHQLMRKIKCCSCGRFFSNQESLKLILVGKIDCMGCHNTIISVDNFNKKKIIIGSVFLLFFSFFLMNSGELSHAGFVLILPLIMSLHLFRATRKFSFDVLR